MYWYCNLTMKFNFLILQMSVKDVQTYLKEKADPNGNLWCHRQWCAGTYTPYRVNTWGLRNMDNNKEEGKDKIAQQVTNQKSYGTSVDCIY